MVKIFSLLADLQEEVAEQRVQLEASGRVRQVLAKENGRLREALAHAISLLPLGPTRRDLQAVLASEQGGG